MDCVEGKMERLQSKLSDLKYKVKVEKEQAEDAHHALVTQQQAGTRHCWLLISSMLTEEWLGQSLMQVSSDQAVRARGG